MIMEIRPIDFPVVDKALRQKLETLIPPFFHTFLDNQDPYGIHSNLLGVALFLDNHPVGVGLASLYTKVQNAHIHALEIAPQYNEPSLYQNLLQVITQKLIENGIRIATYNYFKEAPSTLTWENIFVDEKWNGPQPLMIECLFHRSHFDPDWWYKKMHFEKGFEEILLKDLSPSEKNDLVRRWEQGSIPDYIYPLDREKAEIEYGNSLALRHQGKIVGWIVTHRLTPDLIRYSSLYLEDEFSSTGYWLKLLIDALYIHRDNILEANQGLLEINLNQISKSWLNFIQRRLFPQASQIKHKQTFWKSLV